MAALRADTDLKAQGVSLIGLALNRRGFDRALEADVDEVNFVVVASETFNRRNQAASIAETMTQIGEAAALARLENLTFGVTIAAAFGCPFEGEVAETQISKLAAELSDIGVEEIALADTIGVGDPVAVERRIAPDEDGGAERAHPLSFPQYPQHRPRQRLRRVARRGVGAGHLDRRDRRLPLRARRHGQHTDRGHPLHVRADGRFHGIRLDRRHRGGGLAESAPWRRGPARHAWQGGLFPPEDRLSEPTPVDSA